MDRGMGTEDTGDGLGGWEWGMEGWEMEDRGVWGMEIICTYIIIL